MADIPEQKKRGTDAEFDEAFAPIALEIGQFARAWNGLHEEMAAIFARIVSAPSDQIISLAVWHSTANDRAQREMLRAATRAWIVRNPAKKSHEDSILWLLNETDKLADKRNDALHAPLNVLMDMSTFKFTVEANYFYGNQRASKLRDKDIKVEFFKYRTKAEKLRKYAVHVLLNLASVTLPPQIPTLPTSPKSRTQTK